MWCWREFHRGAAPHFHPDFRPRVAHFRCSRPRRGLLRWQQLLNPNLQVGAVLIMMIMWDTWKQKWEKWSDEMGLREIGQNEHENRCPHDPFRDNDSKREMSRRPA